MNPTTNNLDIENIRRILKYRKKEKLAKLLKNSRSEIYDSSDYGTYKFSTLCTFEIYSPVENYDILKQLNTEEKKEILNAVKEIYPPKAYSYEFTDIEFYMDVNLMTVDLDEEAGLYAFCRQCGEPQGRYMDLGDLIKKVITQKKCMECNTRFSIMNDGTIYNLKWDVLPNREQFIINLLEKEYNEKPQQFIFCYEDRGKKSKLYRYPQKRMRFFMHEKTDRASPAYAMMINDKEKYSIEKSYCFDSPYALFQLAKEALKGYYWLKYDIKVN